MSYQNPETEETERTVTGEAGNRWAREKWSESSDGWFVW
jgi:hypothetical protein